MMRRFSSPVITAIVVGLVVGGATAVAAPTAVTSVVKFAKRATFAKKAGTARKATTAKRAHSAKRAKYATKAGTARRSVLAMSAGVANNSTLLQGHPASDFARGPSTQKIDFRAHAGTGETALLDTGKLLLTASCDSGGHVRVLATTRVDHADIESFGNGGDTQLDDFSIADSPRNLGPTQGEFRSVMYTEPGGQTVEVRYLATDRNIAHTGGPLGGTVDCLVTGFAVVD